MKRSWYKFQAAAGNKPATLSIYDDIGMWGVTARDFIAELRNFSGDLELEVSSLGGSVFEGVAIYNALKRYREQEGNSLTVRVMGVAASIASYIAMAGGKIVMPANTYLMVHKPWGGVAGNADEMRDYADVLDKIEGSLIGAYASRSGKSEDEIRTLLAEDTWMTAQEAVDAGFADEVVEAIEVESSYEAERLPENLRQVFAASQDDLPADPPADDEKPTSDDEQQAAAKPFAEDAQALITAAGLQDHAVPIILACADVEQVKARIEVAREIQSLCKVAGKTDMAASLIRGGKTVADARAQLVEALATEDEQRDIDPQPKNQDTPKDGARPASVNPQAIWAARQKQQP
jgi:ATP-dependent Clp protease, protease subunit